MRFARGKWKSTTTWTRITKKRTAVGPQPESETPAQRRLECRSRTAISCDSHERREQHFRRPAEKADRFWSAPNPSFKIGRASCRERRENPFLGIARRNTSKITEAGEKREKGLGTPAKKKHT